VTPRPSGQLLTPAQVAKYLGQSEHWVGESIADGTLPARRIRRRWFVSKPELDAWLAGEGRPMREPARQVLPKGGRRR
jgi:excisionase family DNA binding protein